MNKPETLTFMMGEFAAEFPCDRRYARNHMWAAPGGESSGDTWRFGFSAYAVRLLQDVYFLEWSIDAGAAVAEKQEIGFIESSKAESSLYAPVAGRLTQFNEQLLSDPSAINVDKYDSGWLFEIESVADLQLMSAPEYLDHLEEVWKITQRTIKGQMNE